MPQQQQQNVKKTKKRKPRQTKPREKYVFKVIKPSATPYKQTQEPRAKVSSEDVLSNLLKQQQQQNALQQQQMFSGFISQLGTLAKQQPVISGFSTSDGKQQLYPIAQAEIINPYKSEIRATEAFVVPETQKKEYMPQEEGNPPLWAIPKKEEDVWKEVKPVEPPSWYGAQHGVSPFEQPPRERTYEKEQKLYPIFEKQKRQEKGIRIEDLHKYPNLPKRTTTTIQVEKEKAEDDGMTALERERERLIEKGGPWTLEEAKIVFETDFKDKGNKKALKILTENGMII